MIIPKPRDMAPWFLGIYVYHFCKSNCMVSQLAIQILKIMNEKLKDEIESLHEDKDENDQEN